VLVTTLIIARIWYLSPRKTHDVLGGRFPTGTGRAAIDMVVESGMLYLVVQLIFVVLFAIGHPAQGIIAAIAVQIYVGGGYLKEVKTAINWSCRVSHRYYS
jgi:hypothetical protein